LPSDSESKQVSYRLFFGLPKKIANTIQATAKATTSIRSVMGSVLDHTRPFVVNEPRRDDSDHEQAHQKHDDSRRHPA
jgi:hypothetical protein